MFLLLFILLAISNAYCQNIVNTDSAATIEELIENYDTPQSFLIKKQTPSNFSFGFEVFTGYGIFTGELSDRYTNNVPLGVAFNLSYKKLEPSFRVYAAIAQTKSPSFYIDMGNFEFDLGYALLNKQRFKLSPFLGIASMGFELQDKRLELKYYELDYTKAYTAGANFDIKFPAKNRKSRNSSSYGFFRIRYEYSTPKFSEKYDNVSGNMHTVTLGMGSSI